MDKRYAAAGAAGAALVLCALALILGVIPGMSAANPTPPDDPGGGNSQCGTDSGFLAYFATGNRFGPPVTATDTDEILAQLHTERCLDSAKTVAHEEYQARAYSSPEERAARTRQLRDDPDARAEAVKKLEEKEATAVKVEVTTMSDQYQTMYMVTEGHDVPYIYGTTADRPTFQVLKFTYADGSWDAYKLDCDFQPVATKFPGLPTAPPPPPTDTETPPPTDTPGTTVPPTTEEGKNHEDSPVSDDPNDPCEACRPNELDDDGNIRPSSDGGRPPTTTTPSRPPGGNDGGGHGDSGPGAVTTVPTPTTSAPPPAPPTTASPPPPAETCQDPLGVGLCD